MIRNSIILLLIFYSIYLHAQTIVPKEVTILNKDGALFTEAEKPNFSKASVRIPYNSKLKVLKMETLRTDASEVDEEFFYYYQVNFNGKIGWIKAIDTNFAQIEY